MPDSMPNVLEIPAEKKKEGRKVGQIGRSKKQKKKVGETDMCDA